MSRILFKQINDDIVQVANGGQLQYGDDSWIADGFNVTAPAHEEGKKLFMTLLSGTSAQVDDFNGVGQHLVLTELHRTRNFVSIGGVWVERNPCVINAWLPMETISANQQLPLQNANQDRHGYLVDTTAAALVIQLPDNPTDQMEIPIGRFGANSFDLTPGAAPAGTTVQADPTGVTFNIDLDRQIAKYHAGTNDWRIIAAKV